MFLRTVVAVIVTGSAFSAAAAPEDLKDFRTVATAKTVIAAGADAISLVSLDDAVRLREAGIRVPILVYAGNVPAEHIVRAAENHDLIATLHSEESLAVFARHARKEIKVAVKVEVGPERIGIPAEDAVRFVKAVTASLVRSLRSVFLHSPLARFLRGR